MTKPTDLIGRKVYVEVTIIDFEPRAGYVVSFGPGSSWPLHGFDPGLFVPVIEPKPEWPDPSFTGRVLEAGGKQVTILVDDDTDEYPDHAASVTVSYRNPPTLDLVLNRRAVEDLVKMADAGGTKLFPWSAVIAAAQAALEGVTP